MSNVNHLGGKVLSACLGALATLVLMYVAVAGRYVSRADVSQMIATESPYVRDAKWIDREMTSLSHKMDEMNEKMDRLLAAQTPG